jgi:hypothetical protein
LPGAGLRQERLSTAAGFCCPDKENWFLNATALNETIATRGAADQVFKCLYLLQIIIAFIESSIDTIVKCRQIIEF